MANVKPKAAAPEASAPAPEKPAPKPTKKVTPAADLRVVTDSLAVVFLKADVEREVSDSVATAAKIEAAKKDIELKIS